MPVQARYALLVESEVLRMLAFVICATMMSLHRHSVTDKNRFAHDLFSYNTNNGYIYCAQLNLFSRDRWSLLNKVVGLFTKIKKLQNQIVFRHL